MKNLLFVLFLSIPLVNFYLNLREQKDLLAQSFGEADQISHVERKILVTESLIFDQNLDNPEVEFINGFKKVCRTKEHPKTKGIDFQISVPNSWSIQEGDRPNIIKKVVSQNGKGNEMVMLIVSDLGNTSISNILFTTELMKQFVPKGGKYISSNKVTLDKIEGGMIEFEQIVAQLDFKLKVRGLFFIIPFKSKLIQIQCFTGGIESEVNIEEAINKFRPLFRMIGNSLVINNQYL